MAIRKIIKPKKGINVLEIVHMQLTKWSSQQEVIKDKQNKTLSSIRFHEFHQ